MKKLSMNSSVKLLTTAFLLAGSLINLSLASAATYRLELKSGNSVLQSKSFEYTMGTKSKFNHPHSSGSEMAGLAVEIGDSISACGTFLQVKRKYEPQKGTFDVVGAMVTLVEKDSIQSGKIKAQTADTDHIEKNNQTVAVKNVGLNRTCTLAFVK